MSAILIAGGGTGGHVFPGLAVADALSSLADVVVTFAGTRRGIEARVIPPRGYALELLRVEPIKGGGASRAVRGAVVAARETARALAVVRRIAPRVVLSVGGYAAGPVSLAAVLLGIPLAVLEPNSVLGLTNRVLSPVAARAYLAWPDVARAFRAGRARIYGAPLRAGFTPMPYAAAPGGVRRVLVLGGSQGASALNERVPAAMARVAKRIPGLEVVHQAGTGRDEAVKKAYADQGFERVTVVPFVDDVAPEIARADLILARGGACTVAEIAAIGRPCILVPFPHAADDHQAKNALALAQEGAAICLRQEDANEDRLESELARLLSDDAARSSMADRARAHGKPQASIEVARDLLDLAEIQPRRVVPGTPSRSNGASHGGVSHAQGAS